MLDYSRFASDEREEEDHTRMDRRRFVRRAGFRFLGPSTIEEWKGRAAWHSDACVALGLIGHGIRANKHRAAWSWNARRFQRIKGCTVTLIKQRQSQNELEKLSNLSYVKKTPKLVEICLNFIKGSRYNKKEDERVTNRGNEGTDSRLLPPPPGPGAAHFLQPLHVSQRLFRNSNAVNVERFRGQRVGTRPG